MQNGWKWVGGVLECSGLGGRNLKPARHPRLHTSRRVGYAEALKLANRVTQAERELPAAKS